MTVEELYQRINGNYQDAKKRGMSDSLIKTVVLKFPHDPNYSALLEAWDKKDIKAIFETAHTLKGLCSNLSFTDLLVPVKELSDMYKPLDVDKIDVKRANELLDLIKEKYNKTISAINEFLQD